MIPEPLQWFDRKKNAIITRCELKEGDTFHTNSDDGNTVWIVKNGRAIPIKTNTFINGTRHTYEFSIENPTDIHFEGHHNFVHHTQPSIASSLIPEQQLLKQPIAKNIIPVDKQGKLMPISADFIFARNAIMNASAENEYYFFIKGPFEGLDDDDFVDPYLENIDYDTHMGQCYKTIVSCGGRISCGSDPGSLLPSDVYEIAANGGWSDDYMEFQEIYSGGADILPDYTSSKLAECLLNVLGNTTTDFQLKNRIVSRELIWRALIILRSGPTLMPW